VVLLCSLAASLPPPAELLAPALRLSSGMRLRELRWCGRRVLVQLPPCYTPGGLLHDFEGGIRMRVCPLTERGRAEVRLLRQQCLALLASGPDDSPRDRGGDGGDGCSAAVVAGVPGVADVPDVPWRCRLAIDEDGGGLLLRSRRGTDPRFFESVGVPSPPEAATAHPGETLSALLCLEHAWLGPAPLNQAGVSLKLVQVLIHTDRQRYRDCLVAPIEGFCHGDTTAIVRAPRAPPLLTAGSNLLRGPAPNAPPGEPPGRTARAGMAGTAPPGYRPPTSGELARALAGLRPPKTPER
jgi:hypothetical protein